MNRRTAKARHPPESKPLSSMVIHACDTDLTGVISFSFIVGYTEQPMLQRGDFDLHKNHLAQGKILLTQSCFESLARLYLLESITSFTIAFRYTAGEVDTLVFRPTKLKKGLYNTAETEQPFGAADGQAVKVVMWGDILNATEGRPTKRIRRK